MPDSNPSDKLLEKTKKHLLASVSKGDPKFSYLPRHLAQVEKWANRLLLLKPDADKKIVLHAVWLHDIGLIIGDPGNDHAVNSENEAKRFLHSLKMKPEEINKITHCVRAHRNRDVAPVTLEEKILAVSDSASHMTDSVYIEMANRGAADEALQKLERDIRDVSLFPELGGELRPLYEAWKNLLTLYPR